jgi:hypothetical protein
MDRTVLLEEPEVSVAGDELIVRGSSYPLSEIRSADLVRVPAAASGPVLMVCVGVICLLSAAGEAGAVGVILCIGFLVGAAVWWTQKKPSFQVSVSTEDGATTPFESRDEQTATRVLAAIREARALAMRGDPPRSPRPDPPR